MLVTSIISLSCNVFELLKDKLYIFDKSMSSENALKLDKIKILLFGN